MQNDVMPSVVQMEADELQKLVTEVKETVANFIQYPKTMPAKNTFSSLNMWNIRKGFRSANDIMKRS